MKFLKLLGLAVVFYAAMLLVHGCATKLDSSGPYAQAGGGGMFLFTVDKTLVDSKDTLNAFVTWEYAHHSQVATNWPSVSQAADTIRANAPKWFADALTLRQAYVSSSSIANSNSLNSQVQLIQTAAITSGPLTNNIK